MVSDDSKTNSLEYQVLQSSYSFDITATKYLIARITQVATEKKIEKLGEAEPTAWKQEKEGQLGKIPLIVVLAQVIYDMVEQEIQLVEVLCEEPAYLLECIREDTIHKYIEKYPPISIEIGSSTDEKGDLS